MKKKYKNALLLLLALLTGVGSLCLRAQTSTRYQKVVSQEDRFYLPPSNWLRVFSLGYNEVAADLLWIKTIVYFGELTSRWSNNYNQDDALELGTANHTMNYMNTVADLDPKFLNVYKKGYGLTLFHRGKISRETVQMSVDLTNKGLDNFPDNGELAFNLGFLLYHEMIPYVDDEDEKLEFQKEGAHWLKRSALMPNAPPHAALLSITLLKKYGMTDLIIEHLRSLLVTETDPNIRMNLEFQLRKALGKAAESDITRFRKLQSQWQKELPFISFELFTIIDDGYDVRTMQQQLNPLWESEQLLLNDSSEAHE